MGDVLAEGIEDHGAGVGVVLAVEHEDGRGDIGEGGGVEALGLEAEHIVPGLAVGIKVEMGRVGVGGIGDGVEVVEVSSELVVVGEASGGVVGEFGGEVVELLSEGWGLVDAMLEGGVELLAGGQVEGAAGDEDDGSG